MKNILRKSIELHYTLSVLRNGKVIKTLPKSRNLILDSGLNNHATVDLPGLFNAMLLGATPSPTPVRRDSGAVTLSQSGTTITASGNFFQTTDTGRLLKYNDVPGTEVYLTYVSATQAIASLTASVSSINGTIWYVNETALDDATPVTTNTRNGGAALNGTSWSGAVQTLKRTLVTSPVGAPVTFTEIGFNTNGANTNIFDRDIITGGVSLLTGDQARCTVEVITTYSPTTPLAQGNVATGFDSSGNIQLEGGLFPFIDSNGDGVAGILSVNGFIFGAISDTFSLQPFDSTSSGILRNGDNLSIVGSGYTAGSFKRDYSGMLAISQANTTITALAWGSGNGPHQTYCALTQKLTTPFTKTSVQTLAATLTFSWGRTLIN